MPFHARGRLASAREALAGFTSQIIHRSVRNLSIGERVSRGPDITLLPGRAASVEGVKCLPLSASLARDVIPHSATQPRIVTTDSR